MQFSALHIDTHNFQPILSISIVNYKNKPIRSYELVPEVVRLRAVFQYISVAIQLNFLNFTYQDYLEKNQIQIIVKEKLTTDKTKKPLQAKIKIDINKNKKFAMICSKVYYGDRLIPDELERWFVFAKKLGYGKIFLPIIVCMLIIKLEIDNFMKFSKNKMDSLK